MSFVTGHVELEVQCEISAYINATLSLPCGTVIPTRVVTFSTGGGSVKEEPTAKNNTPRPQVEVKLDRTKLESTRLY